MGLSEGGGLSVQKRDLFDLLAKGLAPESCGLLDNRADFSRRLPGNTASGWHYGSTTFKVGGSPIMLPDMYAQFEEAVLRAAHANAQNPEFDYASVRGTLYVRQKLLAPGEYSVSGGVHIDTDPAAALAGIAPRMDIFLVSDHSDLTTRYFTDPLEFDRQAILAAPAKAGIAMFSRQLYELTSDKKALCGAAFELVRGSELHVHEAQTPRDTPQARTFISIIFEQDTDQGVIYRNQQLSLWQDMNQPEHAARRRRIFGLDK